MRTVILLLLGVHLAYAGTHSLKYFYTAVSGDIDFPEFTIVGLVDEGQFMYFDSNIKRVVPKTEWMRQKEGADYWDGETQTATGTHQNFRNNIQVAKERFNHSTGVHSFQFMYGCQLDDDGSTRGYWQYGYDGDDFISFDKSTLTWTAPNAQAVITKKKWDDDKAGNEYQKTYLENECIEWLKKYVGYGKDTLERKDAPEVFLLQKDPSSPVLCQATGFYPSNIMMTWQKNKEDHYEDVAVGTTLPNIDGTFQKTITLNPEEWKNNKEAYRCVVQHVGAAQDIVVTVKDIRSNPGSDNTIAIVVGCLVAVAAVLAAIVGLVLWKRSNGYGKASTKDSDSENSDQQLSQVTSK
ncbi:H-2 class I histocompatibility antigen, Q9 alpha chain-like [Ctenopharyngodon idella]|uniref:H-2 class I histocompatibility antigen, Q9 alpha chain-like n=1 Tax=Ctenopharyngodon idella TaxID=7959 RepID=UPI00222F90C5|nr:H-2 class I histocompatibility antigen, Q9 alpha chain-like [Ctenopharyngodon idella]XP_051728347.1 H-2 class I histocompatibility antigen, Q9 alpha chain-like [Ctenopharyngodon idella]